MDRGRERAKEVDKGRGGEQRSWTEEPKCGGKSTELKSWRLTTLCKNKTFLQRLNIFLENLESLNSI